MSKLEFTCTVGLNDQTTWYSTLGDGWSSDYAIAREEYEQHVAYVLYSKYCADHNNLGSFPNLEDAINAANEHRTKMLTEKEHDLFA